jgi:signal transduction histidine kinase
MKIAYKILLLIILPISILSVLTIMFINNILHKELEQRFVENLERTTSAYATLVDAKLERLSEFAIINARQYSRNPSILRKKVILNNINEILELDSLVYGSSVYIDTAFFEEDYSEIYYIHKSDSGRETIIINSNQENYNAALGSNPSYIENPKRYKKGFWTSPYFDEGLSNAFMVTYSEPIIIDDVVNGVVTLDLRLSDLEKLLNKNERIVEGNYDPRLLILNNTDSVIVYAKFDAAIGLSVYEFQAKITEEHEDIDLLIDLDTIFKNSSGSGRMPNRLNNNTLFLSYASINDTNWKAVNFIDQSQINEYISSTIYNTILYIVVLLIALILIVFYTSRLITKPVLKLSKAVVGVSKGEYKQKVKVNSKDEVGLLAGNFNRMVGEIESREQRLEEANKRLSKAQEQLLKLDDAKNEFLKMISHELRTPLNGIVGSTYFLKDMIEDPEMSEFVEMLRESVDRLDSFSKLALEITEIVAQGSSTKTETFSIDLIINEVISEFKQDIENKELTVKTNFAEGAIINSQPGYFKRSFEELMSNAIKYSFNNTSIDINVSKENSNIILKVSNTGEKIEKERIEDLTKPFGLGKEHIDKNTGLGLAYIKQYLELNRATLSINSNEELTEIILIFKAANL